MIKINLLPTKKKPPRKVTELQQQFFLGALILSLVVIGMWYHYENLKSKINNLTNDKKMKQEKIAEQDNMLKEVQTVEDERKRVNEKIDTIEQLKKNQGGLVRLLDEVSKALPLGVNLTSLSESKGQVNIDGTAFTNNDVVRFIDNLKASPLLTDVFLQETVQMVQDGVDIYRYKLQFTFKGA